MLIEVRRRKRKSSQDLLGRFRALKESCHIEDFWKGKKLAMTSLDPQFVSDLYALLIEIFNLGVL